MTASEKKIGFIGGGNMGEAFIGAIIKTGIFQPAQIQVSDISDARLEYLANTYNVSTTRDNLGLFTACDVLMLAIKPQQLDTVLSRIATDAAYRIENRKLVVSIVAGVRLAQLEALLYSPLDKAARKRLPIIRVMPNTPALVLSGMSGMSPNSNACLEDIDELQVVLEAVGQVLEFEEDDMDAVTAVSGSGPAYVFYLAEAMIAGGIKIGLQPEQARTLALTTLKGAVTLLDKSGEPPENLRANVTSPGGTTEAAITLFEAHDVKTNIIRGIEAAAARSRELSR